MPEVTVSSLVNGFVFICCVKCVLKYPSPGKADFWDSTFFDASSFTGVAFTVSAILGSICFAGFSLAVSFFSSANNFRFSFRC